jgi:hypothetical protein
MAHAANGIDVMRGADSTVFGNCVPSLVVENKSAETIEPLAKLFGCREWRRPMGGHKGDVAP